MTHQPETSEMAQSDDRYGSFRCDDQLIIYDLEDAQGWLGSDTTIPLAERV